MSVSEKLRQAALRTWADPEIRAKRLEGQKRAIYRPGRPKVVDDPVRLGAVTIPRSVREEIRQMAQRKNCSVSELIRAYLELGLYGDANV